MDDQLGTEDWVFRYKTGKSRFVEDGPQWLTGGDEVVDKKDTSSVWVVGFAELNNAGYRGKMPQNSNIVGRVELSPKKGGL